MWLVDLAISLYVRLRINVSYGTLKIDYQICFSDIVNPLALEIVENRKTRA